MAVAGRPLTEEEIREDTGLPAVKVACLLRAYVNPMHLFPLLRAGVRLERDGEKWEVKPCRADPRACRPKPKE